MSRESFHVKDLGELESTIQQILLSYNDIKLYTLKGELGSGKTTFVQAACRILNVGEEASSPTFAIINEYGYAHKVIHMDLYRLSKIQHLLEIGFEEYLATDNYIFIEWPELAYPLLPYQFIEIQIVVNEDKSRTLFCNKTN